MKRSSFLHNVPAVLKKVPEHLKSALKDTYRYLRSLSNNRYFWGGLGVLLVIVFSCYLLFNHIVMPAYTRYDTTVQVPDVRNRSLDEARQILATRGLNVGKPEQRYNQDFKPNVILDQTPPPDATVKPGRFVYVTINSGQTPMVQIPHVEGMSLREARNRLLSRGLEIEEERPDSIPSPYSNTITRQQPSAGETVPQGSGITLWYSTGLGERYVVVPDVTGMSASEARQLLLQSKLRSVVLGRDDVDDPTILRQSREPGTRVREGFEIRLYTQEE